jgi:hypothetical protein
LLYIDAKREANKRTATEVEKVIRGPSRKDRGERKHKKSKIEMIESR